MEDTVYWLGLSHPATEATGVYAKIVDRMTGKAPRYLEAVMGAETLQSNQNCIESGNKLSQGPPFRVYWIA